MDIYPNQKVYQRKARKILCVDQIRVCIAWSKYQNNKQWYTKFDDFMYKKGFHKCNFDHYILFKRYKSSYIILLLYVDDILVVGLIWVELKT